MTERAEFTSEQDTLDEAITYVGTALRNIEQAGLRVEEHTEITINHMEAGAGWYARVVVIND